MRPLRDPREQSQERPPREPVDHQDVQETVVHDGVGQQGDSAADRARVADRDECACHRVLRTVDDDLVVDLSQPKEFESEGDVVACAPARPTHPVRPLVDERVETGRHSSRDPDVARSAAGEQSIDRTRWGLEEIHQKVDRGRRIVVGQAESAGEVVPGA
ncbi:hypothetical protein GCM10025867_23510 [Frondihabitans sucicola]|uniref:Uncharacterized protein n=1 Tax=Frondihabitans sucicola TaxID=1268041 RepID=A0ABN6XYL8_9MICO|nr:hypothetical protein GCM10025867_23510 [Frondihabitans sucicola]